jgi:hypothetical protein
LRFLNAIARSVIPDYRLTWYQLDWWKNQWFNDVLDRFDERSGFNTHRHWTLWQLLELAGATQGETAECGVYQGLSSYLICARTGDRPHHLFDSFEGLSEPGKHDDAKVWVAGDLSADEDFVREKLEPFLSKLQFHKGWIPDRFSDVEDRFFAFVHIDVDLYQPTLDSMEFFYPRLSKGGVLICDDYACSTCPGATRAIDQFLADKPEKMISLDAGGGFIIKGINASPTWAKP